MMELRFIDYTKEIKGATVLDRINLTMEGGKVYGLRGENGSGKTMLLRAACGLILPSSGSVEIDGTTLRGFPQSVGLLIEEPDFIAGLSDIKNLESIAQIKGIISREEIGATLAEVGLDPNDRRPFRKYSLGMKKRLGIACALMENPDLILLDEPFNGLDEEGVALAKKAIKRRVTAGSLCVVACHGRELLEEVADVIVEISNGRVMAL